MNPYNNEILKEIKIQSVSRRTKIRKTSESAGYHGNTHHHYFLTVPVAREIAKSWARNHKDITLGEFINLLNSLYQGESYEEKTMGGKLLGYLPYLRKQVDPLLLNKWLNHLEGWAEVDSLCQSTFTAQELLTHWREWKTLIQALSSDSNINKRRASLVLLTGVVNNSNDSRLANLTFEIIDTLKEEKDILITKAVSWLLRDLIRYHRNRVQSYLDQHRETLPKIAIRETRSKLTTGKK